MQIIAISRCYLLDLIYSSSISSILHQSSDASTTSKATKKRSERRKHCALAVVRRSQNFFPAADSLPGDAGRPKFNQLEMVTTVPLPTNPV